jgi:hypothetical protein
MCTDHIASPDPGPVAACINPLVRRTFLITPKKKAMNKIRHIFSATGFIVGFILSLPVLCVIILILRVQKLIGDRA